MPAVGETLRFAFRESGVIEHEFRSGALIAQLKAHDLKDTWLPMIGAPSLNETLVRNEFDVASADDAGE